MPRRTGPYLEPHSGARSQWDVYGSKMFSEVAVGLGALHYSNDNDHHFDHHINKLSCLHIDVTPCLDQFKLFYHQFKHIWKFLLVCRPCYNEKTDNAFMQETHL